MYVLCLCCTIVVYAPVTFNNVFEAVKTIRNWRELEGGLGLHYTKLEVIQRQHVSDEARLKAAVEAFLLGEGYQPSWRSVIHQLHQGGESRLAERSRPMFPRCVYVSVCEGGDGILFEGKAKLLFVCMST